MIGIDFSSLESTVFSCKSAKDIAVSSIVAKQTHIKRGSVVSVCSKKGLDDVIVALLSGSVERLRSTLVKRSGKVSE